jgi:AAA15 family ATPase/GTPase
MAIGRVEIKDFLVFKGEFSADFCPGVNVITGANATGKTTLLKVMYYNYADVSSKSAKYYDFPIDDLRFLTAVSTSKPKLNAVFIPTTEMLSHAKSLLAFSDKYILPFNQTEIDILVNAELPETREVTPNAKKILNTIESVIGGEVLYENDMFYIVSENGKIPFVLEASGFQKFGLLWKLLRNGLLESGSVLFWDEPEASINPELMSVLVDTLLELQRGGVQIFIATHNSNLAQLFDIRQTDGDSLLFCNLSKNNDGTIRRDSAAVYAELPKSVLEDADEALYKAVVARAMGVGVDADA